MKKALAIMMMVFGISLSASANGDNYCTISGTNSTISAKVVTRVDSNRDGVIDYVWIEFMNDSNVTANTTVTISGESKPGRNGAWSVPLSKSETFQVKPGTSKQKMTWGSDDDSVHVSDVSSYKCN